MFVLVQVPLLISFEQQNVDDMSPAAFIALLILRSLDTTSITNPTVAPTSLTQKLKPLLAKREIKVRCSLTWAEELRLLEVIR
jgi:hypothetical protein